MEKNIFEIVLQTISTGLIEKIMSESGLDEDTAMENLYSSAIYSALEREETKLWHYSVPLLYELYAEEMISGRITLPEY
jgi:hypothetical protein